MDLASVKAELKAWERAFKSEHGRHATPDDIKQASGMPEKYKRFKALSKAASRPTNSKPNWIPRPTPSTPPQTVPRNETQLTHSIPRKAWTAEEDITPLPIHPFSPTKRKSTTTPTNANDLFGVKLARSQSRGNLTFSLRSPSPQPESTPDSPFTLARKRLRGEETLSVQPFPEELPEKRRRIGLDQRSQSTSTVFPSTSSAIDLLRSNSLASDEIPESPAKRPITEEGSFSSLFVDTIQHRMKRAQTLPSGALFPEASNTTTSEQPKHTVSSWKAGSTKSTLDLGDVQHGIKGGPVYSTTIKPSKAKTRKRSEVDSDSEYGKVASGSNAGLPAPPLANGRAKGKLKKAKLTGSYEDADDSADGTNIVVEEWMSVGPLAARPPQPAPEMDGFDELLIGVHRPLHLRDAPSAVSGSDMHGEADDSDVEVRLPEEMLRVLALSPSKHVAKMETAGRSAVENLLAGKRESRGVPVWDAGEVDQSTESKANDSEDDEWEGEGTGWWEADL